ncbi:hypothetical protein C8J57DRAFT_1522094 [Mycena rebaudengoi]|nr:hypothetical protein C8J57DRAFT_1522094 [Mycena rebaudengoi]
MLLEDGGVLDTKLKIFLTSLPPFHLSTQPAADSVLGIYNDQHPRGLSVDYTPSHQAMAYALGELGTDIVKGNLFA